MSSAAVRLPMTSESVAAPAIAARRLRTVLIIVPPGGHYAPPFGAPHRPIADAPRTRPGGPPELAAVTSATCGVARPLQSSGASHGPHGSSPRRRIRETAEPQAADRRRQRPVAGP